MSPQEVDEILRTELRRTQMERDEAMHECMKLRSENHEIQASLQSRCYNAEERAELAELQCEEKDRQMKRRSMKMKVKIDEIEDRCRQQLQSVFEEAEEKLIAGQAKNTNAVASLQGITEKQSSVVQYLQATLERTSTRSTQLERQLFESNEILGEEQKKNDELRAKVGELERSITNERRARQLAKVVGTARECRQRVEEQVKTIVQEGACLESKWGLHRKSLDSVADRVATCEAACRRQ
eukprot:CAMPEP_0198201522 /NCGR_PEP_ID=MMETSP1445-20131203/4414_1 /TAXON_ID=36898 /ORGANISM="Pyramimonas sp., Strain CCMP2087" /LENGTH=239 /DNA_ID=CAMNT_0043871925 /DNA_START=287 /DNA_END=1006 /DNA_ORIENTATION=-